ncbi:WD40/YVTN/BNR-like repeat-containing protein [Ventosimonas gracilis]|nr:YCF48-related protein [Ventosimonas gracilis]
MRGHVPALLRLAVAAPLLMSLGFSPAALAQQETNDSANQADYAVLSNKAVHGLLLGIARAGTRLVAVGERGHILYSDDNGSHWTQAKVPTRQVLTAVRFVDAQNGWAVGYDKLILHSADGGESWSVQHADPASDEGAPLLDLLFTDENTGFAIGAYGALYNTTDAGKHWQEVSDWLDNPDGYHLNGIAQTTDGTLFIVGEAGSIFRSRSKGLTWETLQSPYDGSLFGVLGSGQSSGVLVFGLRGHIYHSTDLGENWQRVAVQAAAGNLLEYGLSSGLRTSDGRIFLVGHGGTLLQSRDFGQSFQIEPRSDLLSLSQLALAANGNLVLVGQAGVLVTAAADGKPLAVSQR